MTTANMGVCPECGSQLEDGFIGYASGLLWHKRQPSGWQRLFPFALTTGRFVIGNWASTPWVRLKTARRCVACGTLVLPGRA
jgi:hypothetical protein